MQVNCCECRRHKGQSILGVIGLLWNKSITSERLRTAINELDTEYPLCKYELSINSIDKESAQKYGLFSELDKTSVLATRSPYIVNFYLEYDTDVEKLDKQLCDYVRNHKGTLVMIDPEGDEVLMGIKDHIEKTKCMNLVIVEEEKSEPEVKEESKKKK